MTTDEDKVRSPKMMRVRILKEAVPPIVLRVNIIDEAAEQYRLQQAEELLRQAGLKPCRSADGEVYYVLPKNPGKRNRRNTR